jgi:hypothetical protein
MRITFNIPVVGHGVLPLLLSTLVASGISLSAYGQTAPVKKPPAAPKVVAPVKVPDVVVQGQVFIVTKGGNNIKLALVNVAAYREKDMLVQFDKTWETEQEVRLQAAARIEDAKAGLAAAEAKSKESSEKRRIANAAFMRNTNNKDLMTEYVVAERIDKTDREAVTPARQAITAARNDLAALSRARHFIEKLSDPVAASKTDADGNFDLTVPAGAYVLVATGKRLAGGSTELYEWMVRVDAAKPLKVMLSNDNLNDTNCSECVALPVRAAPAPASMAPTSS